MFYPLLALLPRRFTRYDSATISKSNNAFTGDTIRGAMKPFSKIACIGEVMIEIVSQQTGDATLNVAGDSYNTAVYLAQLARGSDCTVSYVTALGQDTFSQRVVGHMKHFGIDTAHIERRADRNIGLYAIDTDSTGERSFTYWRSESAARTLFSTPCTVGLDVLGQFDLAYLSGITLAILPAPVRSSLIDALAAYRRNGGLVAYDSNHRPRLWENAQTAIDVNNAMWTVTDIAVPSVDDEMAIHGDTTEDAVLARLDAAGLTDGALKRGPAGPFDLTRSTSGITFTPATEVVDTTAAGDSFNAGYLFERARGSGQAAALQAGHDLAARVIGHKGAIIEI
ncbi:2-dehydro-3-deoxygluconokinase [Pseudosulfitobacter pseudonitzschiae]|uniref:2-dehydro-3-deoxygluconokinase n=2 Tax=Rhodobacterales TaxID=204455 RepID=A0A221JXD6_9RHOB|nr:sugar kinase [Pseudosulfitobacter pseudonitzschiae]ASM71388.1 2-dehydro-3-deoxygluconokinase [Pseudosulfitobacter pseudonitzschiae]